MQKIVQCERFSEEKWKKITICQMEMAQSFLCSHIFPYYYFLDAIVIKEFELQQNLSMKVLVHKR